jgi:ABC-2 type transport system ATP-binding protein
MSSETPIVEIRGLSKRFKDKQALDQVSLDLVPGRIVGLLGANAAGKSTLLRHIIGLYLPDAGTCMTFGREAGKLGPAELARIGYVHQEGQLIDWMTVRQLIRYVAAYYPAWDQVLEDRYVNDFEIDLTDRVGALSPGQRQKVAILLAIGHRPQLLILDEPASALDPLARARFLDLLLQLIQQEDRTIVISSHILGDVEKVIDQVVIMDHGHILIDCGLDELRERFCHVRVTSLAGSLPRSLPFKNVITKQQNNGQAILTIENASADELRAQAEGLHCDVEIQAMPLEDLYKVVVTRGGSREEVRP